MATHPARTRCQGLPIAYPPNEPRILTCNKDHSAGYLNREDARAIMEQDCKATRIVAPSSGGLLTPYSGNGRTQQGRQ
ncbi:hypothetical protein ACRALDRAFT_206652 [Sodiomyces alcalophilus JCM 7366]|uniref:uncharacterized protein n=1 Tax=Sodiomyces alcalophilus JCM 7366 TaxID=591952 RepID=UPI0039B5CAE4